MGSSTRSLSEQVRSPHGVSPEVGVSAIQLGKLWGLYSVVENSLHTIGSPSSFAVHSLAMIGCM